MTAAQPGLPDGAVALRCDGLRVTYGETVAVDGVDLEAARGEILGLLGPNGAGKTSVVRALTTVIPVAGGRALVGDRDLRNTGEVRSIIGVLPESNGYPEAMSAPGYLRFFGRLHGLHKVEADRRATVLLRRMGLAGNTAPIRTYSRGMRQRLGLCRSMINRPRVLFLDEPTLGLDPRGKEEILAHLARIADEDGTCVVLCSHLLDEVERVCDRVAIMNRGRVVAHGTVDEVVAQSRIRGQWSFRVSHDDAATAVGALQRSNAVSTLEFDNSRPGAIGVVPSGRDQDPGEVLHLLLDAGVVPRAFDLSGLRLSDAFLALTSERAEA